MYYVIIVGVYIWQQRKYNLIPSNEVSRFKRKIQFLKSWNFFIVLDPWGYSNSTHPSKQKEKSDKLSEVPAYT